MELQTVEVFVGTVELEFFEDLVEGYLELMVFH
jgi:hypothetical protein